MFNILYNIKIEEWRKQYETTDIPNFKVVYQNDSYLTIGTKAILYNIDDMSYYEMDWSVGNRGNDIFKIFRIDDMNRYINNGYKNFLDFKKDCLFKHTHYYLISLYRTRTEEYTDILDNQKYSFYKMPTSDIPRYWLFSSPHYNSGNYEDDMKFLTNIYTNEESEEYKNYAKTYPHIRNILNNDNDKSKLALSSIKRDLEINAILFDL